MTHEEFAALVALATAKDELKQGFIEAEAQLAQTMNSLEVDVRTGIIQEKTIFQRLQAYVYNLDRKEAIGSRLKTKNDKEEDNFRRIRTREDSSRDEDVLVVQMQTTQHDRICPIYKKTGRCHFGNKCSYRNQGICNLWTAGKCRFGDKCRFQHPEKTPDRNQQGNLGNAKPVTKHETGEEKGKQSTLDFSGVKNNGYCHCIMTKGTTEIVNSVEMKTKSRWRVWDSAASVSVTDKLEDIEFPIELDPKPMVTGLNGELEITHEGKSKTFGTEVCYIKGGNTPNLLSMSKALDKNEGRNCHLDA